MSNTSRADTIKLLTELKKELDSLATKRVEETSKQIKVYAEMLDAEKKRRGR